MSQNILWQAWWQVEEQASQRIRHLSNQQIDAQVELSVLMQTREQVLSPVFFLIHEQIRQQTQQTMEKVSLRLREVNRN